MLGLRGTLGLGATALVYLTACGGAPDALAPPPAPIVSVDVPDTATIGIDGVVTLRAKNASGRDIAAHDLAWTSADPAIARVDEEGHVTGVAAGQVDITARTPESGDTCRITVLPLIVLKGLPTDINEVGVVVGYAGAHAFVWTRETGIRDLPRRPGDPKQVAASIADDGTVVGTSGGGDFESDHAVVWTFDPAGVATMTELPWPGGPTAFARGISRSGDRIAGQVFVLTEPNAYDFPRYDAYPALWTRAAGGSWRLELLPVPEDAFGVAAGLNDNEQVVGLSIVPLSPPLPGQYAPDYSQNAVIWTRGPRGSWVMETLATGTREEGVQAAAINASGQVVGTSSNRALLWVRSGAEWTSTDLGTLGGGEFSFAADINDAGEVVGATFDMQGRQRAFIWSAGEGMRDLGSLTNSAVARRINSSATVIGINTGGKGDIGTIWLGR